MFPTAASWGEGRRQDPVRPRNVCPETCLAQDRQDTIPGAARSPKTATVPEASQPHKSPKGGSSQRSDFPSSEAGRTRTQRSGKEKTP